ncbi:hypothetical protein [Cloacibacterium sp. TD35]|uniref:hypothetical protein n=1 Tax=Cloacibacterium sp. TD35 TaxID=2976818 RepID=UPI00237EB8DF|nr:hypothetical protein [Cloacibacterium sp. TD35]WDT69075.1 hypothetical protein N7277_05600 [Cloacibacterium sp. TD35]
MRSFIVFFILIISCKSSPKNIADSNSDYKTNMEASFLKKESPDKNYILFYKIDQQKNSPAHWITFFVVKTKDKTIVIPQEGIAAEDIYWKNTDTLGIIVYKEVEQGSTTVVDKNINNNEITIKL